MHQREWYLTLSNIWCVVASLVLKTLLFRSFHITQVQHNHISCKNERRTRVPPDEWMNWIKWSRNEFRSAEEIPIQDFTRPHKGAKAGQERNTWWAVSNPPQPNTTHSRASWKMILRLAKLSFVGNLLRKSLQAKTETFRGTCLCQIKSAVAFSPGGSIVVSRWYAYLTEYPPPTSCLQSHWSETLCCKTISRSNPRHSPKNECCSNKIVLISSFRIQFFLLAITKLIINICNFFF
jgi:hypothetical protein